MKWFKIFNNDYFNIEYKPDENLMYISYKDDSLRLNDDICFPFLNFSEQLNTSWECIYEDIAFIVDFDYNKKLLRVSHFINYHFDDDIVINFDTKCINCRYYNQVGDYICNYSNASYCTNGDQ